MLADHDDGQDDVFPNDDEPVAEADAFPRLRPAERKRSYGGLIAAVVALLVVAGGGYGIWLNKDAFSKMLGLDGSKVVAKTEPVKPAPAKPATDAAATPPAPAARCRSDDSTQRLTPEGGETDPGPAGGRTGIGEGEIRRRADDAAYRHECAGRGATSCSRARRGDTCCCGTCCDRTRGRHRARRNPACQRNRTRGTGRCRRHAAARSGNRYAAGSRHARGTGARSGDSDLGAGRPEGDLL